MNEEEFTARFGHPPERDDLDRVNCEQAGQPGHIGCGVCEHDKPTCECETCFCRLSQTVYSGK